MEFAGRAALITGGVSGIGLGLAKTFARAGMRLALTYRNEAHRDAALEWFRENGFEAPLMLKLDVTDRAAWVGVADAVEERYGQLDVLVNNAGVSVFGPTDLATYDDYDWIMGVNFGGVVNGLVTCIPRIKKHGKGGHIVNVASMASYAPLQSLNAYCTSKAAVYMFSDCLRAELDAAGIGLTTICPSTVNTNILRGTRFSAPEGRAGRVDGRRAQLEKLFALRRYGPDKAAKAIVSAVQANKPIRPVMPEAYFVYGVSRLLPQALRSTARGRVL